VHAVIGGLHPFQLDDEKREQHCSRWRKRRGLEYSLR
jgi:hypothetical protein